MKHLGLLVSVGAALASAGLGHVYFQRLEAEVSGGPKTAVLVASEDVAVGTALTEQHLAVRDIPQAYVESRHVRASDAKKVLGARVAGGLKASEALLWTDLVTFSGEARALSGLVQKGLRAVAIDSGSSNFEGLLRPGDRVDVLFTTSGKDDAASTMTLLQNLLVLSVGSSVARETEGARSYGARASVTVGATVEQAQLLTQAKERGRLTLTLRNVDDIALVEGVPETTSKDLVPAKDLRDPRPVKAAASKGAIEHVR
jgi:pilus assembly protein CpaB